MPRAPADLERPLLDEPGLKAGRRFKPAEARYTQLSPIAGEALQRWPGKARDNHCD